MKHVKFQETRPKKEALFFFLVVVGVGGQENQIEAAGINMQLIVYFVKCDRSWF